MILPETAAEKLLVSHGRVVGVRTGDKGRGPRRRADWATSSPAPTSSRKVTVLAEGTQGHLTGVALDHFGLRGDEPQVWELGVKEVWKVAEAAATDHPHDGLAAAHRSAKYREFGGSFIYPMGDDMLTIGMVVGLDYRDAELSRARPAPGAEDASEDPQAARRRRADRVGREDDPERRLPLAAEAAARAGPAAVRRRRRAWSTSRALKGIHYAIESGRLAAESAFAVAAARRDAGDRARVVRRRGARQLHLAATSHEVRDMRQVFGRGFFVGGALASAMTVSKGRSTSASCAPSPTPSSRCCAPTAPRAIPRPTASSRSTSSRRSSPSGNKTRDDQPNHIRHRAHGAARRRASCGCTCARRRSTRSAPRAATAPSPSSVAPSNCVQCGAITAKGGRLTPARGRLRARVHADVGPMLRRLARHVPTRIVARLNQAQFRYPVLRPMLEKLAARVARGEGVIARGPGQGSADRSDREKQRLSLGHDRAGRAGVAVAEHIRSREHRV